MADWLIGSHPSLPTCTFDVTVGANTESYAIAGGAYYLYRDGSIDLLAAFQAALNTHTNLAPAEVTVYLGRDRFVQCDSSGSSFSVTFTGDLSARNMMGFDSNLPNSTIHSANNLSGYMWSPGKAGSPDAQLGTQGNTVKDIQTGATGTGYQRSVQHGSYRVNAWEWHNVDQLRVHTWEEASGSYYVFWDLVLTPEARFYLYADVDEDTSQSTPANFSGTRHGPYQWVSKRQPVTFDAPREEKYVHVRNEIKMRMHRVPEYT